MGSWRWSDIGDDSRHVLLKCVLIGLAKHLTGFQLRLQVTGSTAFLWRVEVRALLACETPAFAFGDRGTHLPGWGTRQTGGKARHALLQVVLPIESDSVIFRFEYNPNPNMWHRLGEGH